METIIILLLVGILSFVMGAGLTHIRKKTGLDIDEQRRRVNIETNYFDMERHKVDVRINDSQQFSMVDHSKEAALYLITEKVNEKIKENFDKFISQRSIEEGNEETIYTFEFYTKNK